MLAALKAEDVAQLRVLLEGAKVEAAREEVELHRQAPRDVFRIEGAAVVVKL